MDAIINEYNSIDAELSKIHEKIEGYPKGSLRKRTIKGREYHYLQYRDGKHVKSLYVRSDRVSDVQGMLEERRELERRAADLQARVENYAKLLGIHRSYRPVKNVDYEDYTLFMSAIAHDHKTMESLEFFEKYDVSKYRGIKKRYIGGFLDHINGIDRGNVRRTNDLVLDPYTYLMYFKYGKKDVLREELKKAIPAFLSRGLLITNVQEAVNGSYD